ncbi:MAG: hypothetical protein JSR31_15615 [Nitrospira sp.]|nr:hypothetical protein [Nitrospira sp.]
MHVKIGQLILENAFFSKRAHQGRLAERKAMIDRTHSLPIVRQCQIPQLARSTAYYQLTPTSETTLALMRRIDELHLNSPVGRQQPTRHH